jgi:hypothetical protein
MGGPGSWPPGAVAATLERPHRNCDHVVRPAPSPIGWIRRSGEWVPPPALIRLLTTRLLPPGDGCARSSGVERRPVGRTLQVY